MKSTSKYTIISGTLLGQKMNIVIFGAGGQAKETIDLIKGNVKGKIVGYIDKQLDQNKIFDVRYLGQDQDIDKIVKKYKVTHFFIAIGDLKIRSRIYLVVKKKLKPLSIISKSANISRYAKFGQHVIVYPGATVNADATIGNNVYINSNASIGHEVQIGDHVNINPGASIGGKVAIGDFTTVGIGASIRENLHISKNTTIGGGAMVTKDTKSGKTYIGVPAKPIK